MQGGSSVLGLSYSRLLYRVRRGHFSPDSLDNDFPRRLRIGTVRSGIFIVLGLLGKKRKVGFVPWLLCIGTQEI